MNSYSYQIIYQAHKARLQFSIRPIDIAAMEAIEQEENKWSMLLERIIAAILGLASMNVGLRGHREEVGDGECKGSNFLVFIKTISLFDPLLAKTLSEAKGTHKYLSPTIQNEIIELLGDETGRKLALEIRRRPYKPI